jgi:hypothetical protein
MFCGQRPRREESGRGSAREAEDPGGTLLARADERVGDQERQRTADLLAAATATGHLDLEQLDARLTGVWTAGTTSQLAALEADLPPSLRADRDRREAAARARVAARAALPRHLTSYAGVMLLLVLIWVVAGLNGAGWYPWPVWPALGWGIAVAGQVRTARAPAV